MNDSGTIQLLMTGQVLPTGSVLHRLDPRTRLLGFLTLAVVLVASRRVGPASLAIACLVVLLLVARIPLRHAVKGIIALAPWLLLIALMQLGFGIGDRSGCSTIVSVGPVSITVCTIEFAVLTVLRFVGLVLSFGLLTWTSPIQALVHGIEALFKPLDRVGVPGHQLAMVGVIALRFLPTMAFEADRLLKAQMARGADLDQGRAGVIRRVRRTLPLIVPLLVLALRRAERLAEAMDARAYSGGHRRGYYARLRMGKPDWIALVLVSCFAMGAFVLDKVPLFWM
ncbi:MAG: energy-coupling factor transporter transmembrane protein EcfT [Chloroflexi bacterium]|nr:energy-coupling factor transporter transmembrane protein EcfT [Chloroflexota bacterium]